MKPTCFYLINTTPRDNNKIEIQRLPNRLNRNDVKKWQGKKFSSCKVLVIERKKEKRNIHHSFPNLFVS